MSIDIGIRELQRETSRIVRDVDENGTTYRITIQGRPTAVMLCAAATQSRRRGITLQEFLAADLYRDKTPELIEAQLAELDAARTRGGYVGDSWQ